MRIAFLGSRGIPARYSGFETLVEQLSTRLARRGHEVTVYNRRPFNRYTDPVYEGVRVVSLPTIPTKATDTIVHTTLSALHAIRRDYDIAYFCGVGNSALAFLPRMRGARTVVNVDGADFAREKWRGFGRWWLRRSESWAARLADVVIADNAVIQRRYQQEYGIHAELIPYGATVATEDPGSDALRTFGLDDDGYILYVSRLTPENAADLTIEAHRESGVTMPLVIVGDAPYQREYVARLRAAAAAAPERVVMTGFLFGEAYRQLSYHARAFVLPSAIDATRPVLLEQMGFANCVIVRNTPGNLEVVGDAGLTFRHEDPVSSLADALRRVAENSALAREMGERARSRVSHVYDWDAVTDAYEALFTRVRAAAHRRRGKRHDGGRRA